MSAGKQASINSATEMPRPTGEDGRAGAVQSRATAGSPDGIKLQAHASRAEAQTLRGAEPSAMTDWSRPTENLVSSTVNNHLDEDTKLTSP